jgi:hypothetical protein
VAPIVRAHHEKWNGTGYPDGLKGEEIPIGARILATVDCLDALSSDRQYRKALHLEEAMAKIVEEAGKAYDPKVVRLLESRFQALEQIVLNGLDDSCGDHRMAAQGIDHGARPAAGFESDIAHRGTQSDFLSSIASARQEAHTLFELSQDLGNSLSLDENLSLVAMRLRKLVPYDSIVAYVRKGELLVPEFVSGDNFRLFSAMQIPVGTGLVCVPSSMAIPRSRWASATTPGLRVNRARLWRSRSRASPDWWAFWRSTRPGPTPLPAITCACSRSSHRAWLCSLRMP